MTEEQEREHFASVTLARYGVGSDFPVSLDFHPQKGRYEEQRSRHSHNRCSILKLGVLEEIGNFRILRASRNVAAGEVLFAETPLVSGPCKATYDSASLLNTKTKLV